MLRQNLSYLKSKTTSNFAMDWDNPSLDQLEELCAAIGVQIETLFQFNLNAEKFDWENIRFVFLDVDGVMTEGGMCFTEDNKEFKRFDTKDGMAIKTAITQGIEFGIISSGANAPIVEKRADMLGIQHVYVGTEPKLKIAEEWMSDLNMNWNQVGYIGDDINDLKMLEMASIGACPADSTIPVKSASHFVLSKNGGHGCIREYLRYLPSLKSVL